VHDGLWLVGLSNFPIDKHCNNHSIPSLRCGGRPYHIQAFARGRCYCEFTAASHSMRTMYVLDHARSGSTDISVNPKCNMEYWNRRRCGYKASHEPHISSKSLSIKPPSVYPFLDSFILFVHPQLSQLLQILQLQLVNINNASL
jgi:hypothetical protein